MRGAHFNEGAAFAGKATIFRLRRTVFCAIVRHQSVRSLNNYDINARYTMATGSRSFNPQPLKIILGIIAVLWIALFISGAAPSISMFGIRPRSIPGLIGIFTSPFLHGSVVHLAAK